jgi:hypothetical protein
MSQAKAETPDAGIVMHDVINPKTGQVSSRVPLPADWKIHRDTSQSNGAAITGPGVQITYLPNKFFTYTTDQMMAQSYQMAGQPMRRVTSIEQLIEEDLVPQFGQHGYQLIKTVPLPELAEKDKAYNARLYKVGPSQQQFVVVGTEWKGPEGNKSFHILHYYESASNGFLSWGYYGQVLDAEPAVYEQAKQQLVHGLANQQYDQAAINTYNASEQQKLSQSQAAHNAKMRQRQQQFDQSQRLHRETWDAVNKSSMDAYRSRQQSSDRGQNQSVNAIHDESTVTNPYSGENYQVESGSNHYWMNNDGEYIPTDDHFYNPNADPAINNQDWQEVEPR